MPWRHLGKQLRRRWKCSLSPCGTYFRSSWDQPRPKSGFPSATQSVSGASDELLIFLADVKRIIHAAGFEPNSVAPHLLFPILEAASLQEDEELQDRWACLLANAARPGRADDVLPSFVEVLKQLSPFEAQCLKKLIEEVGRDEGRRQRLNLNFGQEHQIAPLMMGSPVTLAGGGGNPEGLRRFRLALSSLLRLGLIERRVKQPHGPMGLPLNPTDLLEEYWLTEFGHRFLRVCEPPRPA